MDVRTKNGKVLPSVSLDMNVDLLLYRETPIRNVKDAVSLVANHIGFKSREIGAVLCLDQGNRPICISTVAYGTPSGFRIPFREITQIALMSNATSIIFFHNHPAIGDEGRKPSVEDIKSTNVLLKACQLVDVKLLDHIILHPEMKNGKRMVHSYSFRERRTWMFFGKEEVKAFKTISSKLEDIPFESKDGGLGAFLGIEDVELQNKQNIYHAYNEEELAIASAISNKEAEGFKIQTNSKEQDDILTKE